MSLPYTVKKLEEIAEEHRGLYVEKDGTFFLDVAGVPDSDGGSTTTDAELAKRLADLERKKAALEKDLHKERESRKVDTAKTEELEAKKAEVAKQTRTLLRMLGVEVPDDEEADASAELQKRLQQIEEQKLEAERSVITSERDAAKIEAALVRAVAGKAADVDYAIYRARALDAFAEVKVENGKVVGIDALLVALAEAEVIGKTEDQKPDAPNVSGQPKLQKGSKVWRDAKDWTAFLELPVNVQTEAREKDPDFVRSLERRFYGSL